MVKPDGKGAAGRGFSRRRLFQGAGAAAAAGALLGPGAALGKETGIRRQGPGAVTFTLRLNGTERKLTAEPRQTLLEALRLPPLGLTGAKPVCDRGQCGACTVWLDGIPVQSCSVLAVEAEGREVTTVEGLGSPETPAAIQRAFVAEDAQQCGFCTPGMVMSCAWAVKTHGPALTAEQVREATAGNLCRCGTYPHVVNAALRAAKGG
jgi:aerobic-type carbon monoxide dehydrogenase small subunit (CoxS/CutS family)